MLGTYLSVDGYATALSCDKEKEKKKKKKEGAPTAQAVGKLRRACQNDMYGVRRRYCK